MKPEDVAALDGMLAVIVAADLSEAEVEVGDVRLAAVRARTGRVAQGVVASEAVCSPAPKAPVSEIRAPMVGYFRATDPPVQRGQTIQSGDVVGCILSLGLPNDVHATEGGVVADVHVTEGDAVEYGTSLFTLCPREEGE